MKKLIKVFCLDTHEGFFFLSRTPYEAMLSLIYYLNISHRDKTAKVQLLGGGRTLSVVHNGNTWSCLNKID